MDKKKKLSDNLKQFRKDKNLTQSDIAEILGKDRSTIAKYENGQADPPFSILRLLAKIYDTTLDELCGVLPANILYLKSDAGDIAEKEKMAQLTKEEQITVYKLKAMDNEKKKIVMDILKRSIK